MEEEVVFGARDVVRTWTILREGPRENLGTGVMRDGDVSVWLFPERYAFTPRGIAEKQRRLNRHVRVDVLCAVNE